MISQRGPRADRGKERYWRACLSRWRRSGLSVREFCRREALSEPSFYAWRRELARRRTSRAYRAPHAAAQRRRASTFGRFLPLQVIGSTSAASTVLEILLPRGRRLRVRPGFDPQTLEAVLDVLERRPC